MSRAGQITRWLGEAIISFSNSPPRCAPCAAVLGPLLSLLLRHAAAASHMHFMKGGIIKDLAGGHQ